MTAALVRFAVPSAAILTSVLFFWQYWLLPGVTMPRGGGDLASFIYPNYAFAAASIGAGHVPFWNPHLYGGAPFAADLQSGLFYAPNWLLFARGQSFVYSDLVALAALHYPLATLTAFALAREVGLAPVPSFAAGLCFALSGFMVAHLGHYNMLAAAAWVPLAIALGWRATRVADLRWAALAGGALGVLLLAGHTQVGLYTGLSLAIVWALGIRLYGATRDRTAVAAVIAGVSALCASVLLLPAMELTQRSIRSDISYAQAAQFAASPLGLLTFIVPGAFGQSAEEYWGISALQESYGYVGVSGVLLAVLGVALSRRGRLPIAVALLGLAALLIALGEMTPLHGWLYRLVPGFDKVRAPGRMLLFVDLAAALLVGFGVAALARRSDWRDRPVLGALVRGATWWLALGALVASPLLYYAAITSQDRDPTILSRILTALESATLALLFTGLTLALIWSWSRRRLRWAPVVAVALLGIDLASASGRFNPTTEDVLSGYRHPALVEFLKTNAEGWRIDTRTGISDVLQPDLAALHGLHDVGGIFNPLTLRDFDRYWEGLGSRSAPGYDLLSVKYLVAARDVPLDPKFARVAEVDNGLAVYENRRAMPRAFVEGGPGGVARFTEDGPNAVVVDLDGGSGRLVVTNVMYPGWTATADGRPVEIEQVHGLFQGVQLPTGARQVRFEFRPRFWIPALALTVVGWAVVAVAGVALARSSWR